MVSQNLNELKNSIKTKYYSYYRTVKMATSDNTSKLYQNHLFFGWLLLSSDHSELSTSHVDIMCQASVVSLQDFGVVANLIHTWGTRSLGKGEEKVSVITQLATRSVLV